MTFLLTSAVSAGEVAALAHEVGDHAVERGALVVQRLPGPSLALLPGAKASEVLRGPRNHVRAQLQFTQVTIPHNAAARQVDNERTRMIYTADSTPGTAALVSHWCGQLGCM